MSEARGFERPDRLVSTDEFVEGRAVSDFVVRNRTLEWCPRPDSNQHAREGNRF